MVAQWRLRHAVTMLLPRVFGIENRGAIYTPGATLKYCGQSSASKGYTILVADEVELMSGASSQVNCDYSNLSDGMAPLKTAALYN